MSHPHSSDVEKVIFFEESRRSLFSRCLFCYLHKDHADSQTRHAGSLHDVFIIAKRLALDNADATGYSPSKPRGWTRALP